MSSRLDANPIARPETVIAKDCLGASSFEEGGSVKNIR